MLVGAFWFLGHFGQSSYVLLTMDDSMNTFIIVVATAFLLAGFNNSWGTSRGFKGLLVLFLLFLLTQLAGMVMYLERLKSLPNAGSESLLQEYRILIPIVSFLEILGCGYLAVGYFRGKTKRQTGKGGG